MSEKYPTVGLAIMTLNSAKHLPRCLSGWLESPLKPYVLVVDSSSEDNTVAIAQGFGVETRIIARSDFNHGATRELARRHLNTDIIVMVTPDAYAVDKEVLGRLVHPIASGQAAAAYARQVPHEGAGFFESFPREFNYPPVSHIRAMKDIARYGVYTFFCSNSCAAYCNKAMNQIGGFKPVLIGEDTVAVAELLRHGHQIAYVSEAVVQHSHCYNIRQEFCRHFDNGLARAEYRQLLICCESDYARGKEYVRLITQRLLKEKPYLLPYAFVQTLSKWFGYRLGQLCVHAPTWLKKCFSSQRSYWS